MGGQTRQEVKTCSRCHRTLDESRFVRDLRKKSGVSQPCKDCHNKRTLADRIAARGYIKKKRLSYGWKNNRHYREQLRQQAFNSKLAALEAPIQSFVKHNGATTIRLITDAFLTSPDVVMNVIERHPDKFKVRGGWIRFKVDNATEQA